MGNYLATLLQVKEAILKCIITCGGSSRSPFLERHLLMKLGSGSSALCFLESRRAVPSQGWVLTSHCCSVVIRDCDFFAARELTPEGFVLAARTYGTKGLIHLLIFNSKNLNHCQYFCFGTHVTLINQC